MWLKCDVIWCFEGSQHEAALYFRLPNLGKFRPLSVSLRRATWMAWHDVFHRMKMPPLRLHHSRLCITLLHALNVNLGATASLELYSNRLIVCTYLLDFLGLEKITNYWTLVKHLVVMGTQREVVKYWKSYWLLDIAYTWGRSWRRGTKCDYKID